MSFESFDYDEDYTSVFQTEDDAHIQAEEIVENESCPVLFNRLRTALPIMSVITNRPIFDIISNYKNSTRRDNVKKYGSQNRPLEHDGLICIRIEPKGAFTSGDLETRPDIYNLDYKGTRSEIVREVMLQDGNDIVYSLCFPSTMEYAAKLASYAVVERDKLVKKVYEYIVNQKTA